MEIKQLNLHLGCGDVRYDGFVNIDARKTVATDLVSDIARLPYESNTVDMIYASHCLEHFGWHEVDAVLAEWARVLKPGAPILIAVPDFDALVKGYTRRFTWNIFKTRLHTHVLTDNLIGDIMGGQDYPENTHRCLFNKASLIERLNRAGFVNAKRITPPLWCQRGAVLHYASMMFSTEKR